MKNMYKFLFLMLYLSSAWIANNEILAEKENAPEKMKVFINDFSTKGLSQESGIKFTNTLSRKFSESYPGSEIYTMKTISLLKKEVEKQLMDNKNCTAEKCQKKISSLLGADYSLTGNLSPDRKNSDKIQVEVLVVYRTEEDFISDSYNFEMYSEQLEYFAGEIVKKTVDRKYTINTKKAPFVGKREIQIQKIKLEDVPNTTIQPREFAVAEDVEIAGIVEEVDRETERGDRACGQGLYEDCELIHSINYYSISVVLSEEKIKKISGLMKTLEDRVKNARTQNYKGKIDDLSESLDMLLPNDFEGILKIEKEFGKIDREYALKIKEEPFSYSRDIERALAERKEIIQIRKQKAVMKRGDDEMQSHDFDKAYRTYTEISEKIAGMKETLELKEMKKDLNQKLLDLKKAGESYMTYQIEKAVSEASSNYKKAVSRRTSGDSQWDSSASDAGKGLASLRKTIIANARYVDANNLKKYNQLARTMKNDPSIPDRIKPNEIHDLGKESKIITDRIKEKEQNQKILSARMKNAKKSLILSSIVPSAGLYRSKMPILFVLDAYLLGNQLLYILLERNNANKRKEELNSYDWKTPAGFAAASNLNMNTKSMIANYYFFNIYQLSTAYHSADLTYRGYINGFYTLYIFNLLLSYAGGFFSKVDPADLADGIPVGGTEKLSLQLNLLPDVNKAYPELNKIGQKAEFRFNYRF